MLQNFRLGIASPARPVNIWMTEMLQLFRPEAEALLRARDAAVKARATAYPDGNAYEDRGLEVTAYRNVSVEDQSERLHEEMRRRGL